MPTSAYRRQIEIPLPLHALLNQIAAENGENMAKLAAYMIHDYLKRHYPERVGESAYVFRDGSLPGPRAHRGRSVRSEGRKAG